MPVVYPQHKQKAEYYKCVGERHLSLTEQKANFRSKTLVDSISKTLTCLFEKAEKKGVPCKKKATVEIQCQVFTEVSDVHEEKDDKKNITKSVY